jgi:hypothetical protein
MLFRLQVVASSDSKIPSDDVQRLKDENAVLAEAKMENERRVLEMKAEVWLLFISSVRFSTILLSN